MPGRDNKQLVLTDGILSGAPPNQDSIYWDGERFFADTSFSFGGPGPWIDVVSRRDIHDGSDWYPAFSRAITSANIATGGTVYVPPGSYSLSSSVALPSGVTIVIAGGVSFTGAGSITSTGGTTVDWRSGSTSSGASGSSALVPTQATMDLARNNGGAAGSMPQKLFNADCVDVYDIKANVDASLKALQLGVMLGKYVWLLPYGPQGVAPGHVAAVYDTTKPFKTGASWQAVDLQAATGQATAEGFLGGCTLNGVLYLSPKQTSNQSGSIGTVTGNAHFFKYDSSLGLPTERAAWSHMDLTGVIPAGRRGWASNCTDGRYVYYCPTNDEGTGLPHGLAIRYDTTGSFTDVASWKEINLPSVVDSHLGAFQGCLFTGKHIFYVQTNSGTSHTYIARFNINGNFNNNNDGAWDFVDVSSLSFTNAASVGFWVGCIFVDGRYLILVPYGNNATSTPTGWLTRFDTLDPAATVLSTSSAAWQAVNLTGVDARCHGYQGGWEAGDFVYLVPTNAFDGAPPPFLRWDKRKPFNAAASYDIVTLDTPPPWQTYAVHDGTYAYCAPLFELANGPNPGAYTGRIHRVYSPDHPAGFASPRLGAGTALFKDVNDNIGINTNDPQYQLDVNGTFHSAGTILSDTTLRASLGTSAAVGKAVLDGDAAAPNVGNTAATATNLKSFSIPANVLSSDGMWIEFWGEGTSAQNANADKNVTVSYGPTGSLQTTATRTFTNNVASATFLVRGRIMRSAAGAQECGGEVVDQAGTSSGYKRATGAKDETAAWTLVFSGNGTGASDVVLKSCGWILHRGQT